MAKDYNNGCNVKEIATKYGVSISTCYRALDIAKQEKRVQKARLKSARNAEVVADYKSGVPVKEIAAKYGFTTGYCSQIANRAGLVKNRGYERIKTRQAPRNKKIYKEYKRGVPVPKLAAKYHLSIPGIYNVIQRIRKQKEEMSLAMDCQANQIERV